MNDLMEVVQQAFNRAIEIPTIPRWKSISIMAGCASVRMAAEGDLFQAAQFEGIADEARRRMIEMQPKVAA